MLQRDLCVWCVVNVTGGCLCVRACVCGVRACLLSRGAICVLLAYLCVGVGGGGLCY